MPLPITSLSCRPNSQVDIAHIAELALRKAGSIGKLPTPINDLIAAAGVRDEANPEALKERFLASLAESVREGFHSVLQKIRGIADLRERVVYVPTTSTLPRVVFAKAHELGHQLMPWQQVNIAYYQDDDLSLSSETKDLFDVEANFFAAEVLFQGYRFRSRALDYAPSLDAVFHLADQHGASRHATLHRFVEEHDEVVAATFYYPSRYVVDSAGFPILRRGKAIGSPRFVKKFSDIKLPESILSDHPWAAARDSSSEVCQGDIDLTCGSSSIRFQWQSWWNTYYFLVLLRHRPALSLVGRFAKS